MLWCRVGSLYTGITNDLPKRLKAHRPVRASNVPRSWLPVRLAYSEPQRAKWPVLRRRVTQNHAGPDIDVFDRELSPRNRPEGV